MSKRWSVDSSIWIMAVKRSRKKAASDNEAGSKKARTQANSKQKANAVAGKKRQRNAAAGNGGDKKAKVSTSRVQKDVAPLTMQSTSKPAQTASRSPGWQKLKKGAITKILSSVAPEAAPNLDTSKSWQSNVNNIASKITAVTAFADPTGGYTLGGERLKLVSRVPPSHTCVPQVVMLDDQMKTVTTFGRAKSNDVMLDSTRNECGISRSHCLIRREPNFKYSLVDERSLNGTYVNDVRVKHKELSFGDRVTFGGPPNTKVGDVRPQPRSEFVYEFEKSAAEEEENAQSWLMNQIDGLREMSERLTFLVVGASLVAYVVSALARGESFVKVVQDIVPGI